MKKFQIKVKAKILGGKFEKTETYDYAEPESLEEAIEIDEDSKVLNTYLTKRKTNFMDKKRKELETELNKKLAAIMGNQDLDALLAQTESESESDSE